MLATKIFYIILLIFISGCAKTKTIVNIEPSDNSLKIKEIKKAPIGNLLNYQQIQYNLNDPIGDYTFLRILQATAPSVIFGTLTGKGYQRINADLSRLRTQHSDSYNSIAIDALSNLRIDENQSEPAGVVRNQWIYQNSFFHDILMDYELDGLKPTIGECHQWSSKIHNDPEASCSPYLLFSKLFWALAYGDSSVYFYTGNETDLANWILSQPDRSVSLRSIFRISYLLNKGNVYLSMLTIANVISRFWYTPERETLLLARKLEVITGVQDGIGDNYGAWHHFWGLMVFGYCHSGWTAWLVGNLESFGSHCVSNADEPDEDYINANAGFVGSELRDCVENWNICKYNDG